MEDFGISVEEELVALDDEVIAQLQLLAVVGVRGQTADPGLGVPGGESVGQLVRLRTSRDDRDRAEEVVSNVGGVCKSVSLSIY